MFVNAVSKIQWKKMQRSFSCMKQLVFLLLKITSPVSYPLCLKMGTSYSQDCDHPVWNRVRPKEIPSFLNDYCKQSEKAVKIIYCTSASEEGVIVVYTWHCYWMGAPSWRTGKLRGKKKKDAIQCLKNLQNY